MIDLQDLLSKAHLLSQTYTYNSNFPDNVVLPVSKALARGWAMVGTCGIARQSVYIAREDVGQWIELQDPGMWKRYKPDTYSILRLYNLPYYFLNDEILFWMELKWT
jgi:hypothetical protein